MALLNTTDPAGSERLNASDRSQGSDRLRGAEHTSASKASALNEVTLAAVADALSRLRYGAVHLTVHDGKVVQLDVTERQRFTG